MLKFKSFSMTTLKHLTFIDKKIKSGSMSKKSKPQAINIDATHNLELSALT